MGYYTIFLTDYTVKARGLVVWWIHYTEEIQMMFKHIAANAPNNGTVYINYKMNDATLEPIAETEWNLGLFYDRGDIQVKSIEEKTQFDKNYIVASSPTFLSPWAHLSESELAKDRNLVKTESIKRTDKYIVFTNPQTVVKQVVKKGLNLLINRERLTADGIYTFYFLNDQWNFYYYR